MNNKDIIDKLMSFCVTNKKEEVESILKQNCNLNLNIQNNKGFTCLHVASVRGFSGIVNLLINSGADILVSDNNANTALHWASRNGHCDIVTMLLNAKKNGGERDKLKKRSKGYKLSISKNDNFNDTVLNIEKNHGIEMSKRSYLNAKNNERDTALHLACKNNHEKVVKELLANDVEVNSKNLENMTPLDYACSNKNITIVELLMASMQRDNIVEEFIDACRFNKKIKVELMLGVKKTIGVSIPKKILDESIFFAVVSEYIDILDLLLESGVDVNARDKEGKTPIFFAINKNILLKLIEKKANLNCKNKNGKTPLFCNAVLGAYENIIELLIEKGASINEKNTENKWTALHAACYNKPNFNVVKILLHYKADIYEKDIDGETAIHICCAVNNIIALRYILKIVEGVDLNITDNAGNTPLHIATSLSIKEMVEVLLEEGVDVNLKNNKGDTPLHIAVCINNKEIVKMLIDHNAKLNIKNSKGLTPIYYACDSGNFDMVNLLIKNGADVNLKSKDGVTPLQCACHSENKDIVRKLLNTGVDIAANGVINALDIAIKNKSKDIQNLLIINMWERMLSVCESGTEYDFNSIIDENLKISTYILNFFLAVACENNNFKIARTLIEKGADVNESVHIDGHALRRQREFIFDRKGRCPIHIAAKRGYKEMVELLIQNGADVMVKDKFKYTPLILIRRHKNFAKRRNDLDGYRRNLEIIELLENEVVNELIKSSKIKDIDIGLIEDYLNQKININSEDKFGNTAIVYACKNGRRDIVERFLRNGINLKRNKHVKKMLINACDSESVDTLKCLLQNDASINVLYKGAMRLLMYACKKGNLSIVKYLSKKYENLDIKDKFGRTAITYAVMNNNLNIVKYLIEKGADMNCKDENNMTLLMYSCKLGYKDMTKYLLDIGVDVLTTDNYGNNVLTYICISGNIDMAKCFIKLKRVDTDYVFKACCAIDEIKEEGQSNTVKYLMEKVLSSLDENMKNRMFMHICKIGNLDLLKLINKEYITKCVNDEDETMLMCACEFGYKEIVAYLLDIGVDIQNTDYFGNNALSYACMYGYKDIVKILIKASNKDVSFVDHKNKYGITPLIYACDMLQACCSLEDNCKEEQIDIVKFLIDNGAIASGVILLCDGKIKNEEVKNYVKERYKSLCLKKDNYTKSRGLDCHIKREKVIIERDKRNQRVYRGKII